MNTLGNDKFTLVDLKNELIGISLNMWIGTIPLSHSNNPFPKFLPIKMGEHINLL